MDRVAAILEWDVVTVDIGWEEDLRVPCEALTGGKVGNQAGRTLRIANVDNGGLLFGDGGAQKTRSALMKHLLFVLGGR